MTKRISLTIWFIIFCLITLTFGRYLPIEIKLVGISFIFYSIILIGLPIAAIKELRKWFSKLKNKNLVIGLKIIFICLSGLYFLYAIFFSFGNSFCGNITDKTLYLKRNANSSKIIVRHFDCGATDSGPADFKIVKVVDIFSIFDFVTKVDTTNIDKTVWIKVEPHD